MRTLGFLAAATVLLAVPLQAAPRLAPEAQLAKLIDGRTAGEAVSCISLRSIRSIRVIEGTAIAYHVGNTLYVNRPRTGAEFLRKTDSFVSRPFSTQLCSTEVLEVFDAGTGLPRGPVFLGEFVPYRGPRLSRR
ncbi:MAG TPA: hypothetical protein VGR19_03690 [Allosphingosinicella sp.]|nr:hypothetical protein [Allosphingosinicella sp.]